MHGLHLTAELYGCPARPLLSDEAALRALCETAVADAGLQAVGAVFHRFAPVDAHAPGLTGVVLLAESHVAVHTWPEIGVVTLDVYVCNRGQDNRAAAQMLMDALVSAFAPREARRQAMVRGTVTPQPQPDQALAG